MTGNATGILPGGVEQASEIPSENPTPASTGDNIDSSSSTNTAANANTNADANTDTTSVTPEDMQESEPQAQPVFTFSLGVDNNRRALNEGSSEGTTFDITVDPEGEQDIEVKVRPVNLTDQQDILVSLEDSTLDRDDERTSVTFHLQVNAQPQIQHERRFNVIAQSGDEVRITELILDVKPINVPDVYLLIGQSNMVGRTGSNSLRSAPGESDDTNSRIRQLNVTDNNPNLFNSPEDFIDSRAVASESRYIRARDPLHERLRPETGTKSGSTVGPGLSFAKAALTATTTDIYLVPAAWESSGFCRPEVLSSDFAWNAVQTSNEALGGVGLLDRAITRLNITLKDTNGIFRGILWQQGETDANNRDCAEVYSENLKLMVERIRREARVDQRGEAARGSQAAIPFIASTQSRGEDDRGDFSLWDSAKQQVDSVHRGISGLVPYADWVNNDDLVPPAFPCGSTGCIHFGPEATREIGRRFYSAIQRVWDSGIN